MRRCLCVVVALLVVVAVALQPVASAEDKGPLVVGKSLPATFHPYNVTARIAVKAEPEEPDKAAEKEKAKKPLYTTQGKFHCLISEYDLDPVVMLFARNLDDSAGFRDLLQKLDGAIDRNPGVRLHAFVVFIDPDEKINIVQDDDKRDDAAKKIQKIADDLKLKGVVLTLAGDADLVKYGLEKETALTAVLYKNLRIEAVHKVTADNLDKADADAVKAIMTDVAGKLNAKR
jgi:hypothetical protein